MKSDELVIHTPQSALTIDQLLGQRALIEQAVAKAMKDGIHFGKIPGCGPKPALLQPGAQLLCHLFRLRPEYTIEKTELPGDHIRYEIICRLYLTGTEPPMLVGEGVGAGSTMESKHRFRGGSRKCPECGAGAIIKGKAEYGGGYICFKKKGGCGAKWPDGAEEIESQSETKAENESIEDSRNTVLKMTKKRAFVDATITATASNDFFTQDLEDIKANQDAVAQRSRDEDEIPMTHTHETKSEPVTADNWREIVVHVGTAGGRINGKKVIELNSSQLKWFATDPKGFFSYWKENERSFGPEEKRLKTAIEFAIQAKKAAKEGTEMNQEPGVSKTSFQMLTAIITKEGVTMNDLLNAAVELSIVSDSKTSETLTEAECQELIARMPDLAAHIKESK